MKRRQFVPRLQQFLRAPREGFIEICGLAGTGKTKIMMDACCRLAISSGPPVLYIDTEGGFNAQYFEDMVSASTCSDGATKRALEKVTVYRIFDGLELQSIISDLCDRMNSSSHVEPPFSAIFVDSVAFPFRYDFRRLQDCCGSCRSLPDPPRTGPYGSLDAGIRRGHWCHLDSCVGEISRMRLPALMDVAKWLREIAQHKITVVVSNHLTETESGLIPALGHAWTERPARRILLDWTKGGRRALVASALLSDTVVEGAQVGFRIFQAGVQDDDEMSKEDMDSGSEFDDMSNNDVASNCGSNNEEICSNESVPDDTLSNSQDAMRFAQSESRSDIDPLTWPPSWWISRPSPVAMTSKSISQDSRQKNSYLKSVPLFRNLFQGSAFSGIVEICGEPATGKTQLCLQSMVAGILAEICRCPSQAHTMCACYLHSEPAPANRLEEIASASIQNSCSQSNIPLLNTLMSSIFMQLVYTPEDLYAAISEKVPKLNKQKRIRLLVIDSFGALFRQDSGNALDRSVQMFRISAMLKRISIELDMPILLTNQVMADLQADSGWQCSNLVKPALGHAWAFCVDHRITLHRSDRSHMRLGDLDLQELDISVRTVPNATNTPFRFARVDLSSRFPRTEVPFIVSKEGLG